MSFVNSAVKCVKAQVCCKVRSQGACCRGVAVRRSQFARWPQRAEHSAFAVRRLRGTHGAYALAATRTKLRIIPVQK